MLEGGIKYATAAPGRFVIPVTVDDLSANGLLADADPKICWERSVETLQARKSEIAGLAVASDERIEACILSLEREGEETEIISFRSVVDDGDGRLHQLFAHLGTRGVRTVRIPKVHAAEIPAQLLETLGFKPIQRYGLYATTARPE